jgi:fucose permease
LALRAKVFRYMTLSPPPFGLSWQETAKPMAILLALTLLLESASHWAIGGWLALYVTRKFGAPTTTSLFILAMFWLSLTCGRLVAGRLPPLEERIRTLPAAVTAGVVGCVFLLKTVDLSGALMGGVLLGAALGVIHPLTLDVIGRRYPYYHPGFLNGFFSASLIGGFIAPWLIAQLAEPLGIEIIIWLSLANLLLTFVMLSAVFVESRLTSQPAA